MSICLFIKIVLMFVSAVGLGLLGFTKGGTIGGIFGALGGVAVIQFWLGSYITLFC